MKLDPMCTEPKCAMRRFRIDHADFDGVVIFDGLVDDLTSQL